MPIDAASPPQTEDRGAARRRAFLDAARTIFLRDGYEAASVTEVVRLAGGSLATLYAQFGSKEGLFLAMAQERQRTLLSDLIPTGADDLPLEDGLKLIGAHFLRALLAPDALAMFRIVIGESRRLPPDLRRFFAGTGERVRAVVAAYLVAHGVRGDDAEAHAAYFIDLVRTRHHFRALAEPDFALSDREIKAHVASAVRFFMRAAL
jgi:AcrR family transcriptional regulator